MVSEANRYDLGASPSRSRLVSHFLAFRYLNHAGIIDFSWLTRHICVIYALEVPRGGVVM